VQGAHELAPGAPLNEPAVHAVQPDVPEFNALYAPAVQEVQTPDVLAAITLPYDPAAHTVHNDPPVVSALNAPTAQAVQAERPLAEE
jgi:hypothetical protein